MVSGAEWRLRAQDIGCWSTGLHLTLSWLYIHAFLVKYRKYLSDFPFPLLAVSLTLTEVNQLISKSGRIVQQVMCMYCEINANLYNWRSTAVVWCSFRAQSRGRRLAPALNSDASNMISEVCITHHGSGQASQANNKQGRDHLRCIFPFLFITKSTIY